MESTSQKEHFRADIQALRGIAVLLVVVYHAGIGAPQAGYLGVDIFFVVSGFLITRIITVLLERSAFSFAEFYTRRVKRLLPAGYTMLAAATVGAIFLLTRSQYHEYLQQLWGSVAFIANIVLWQQVGYFRAEAVFQPLLHMWSLAIEEQYYLLLPITLTLIPKRWWFPLIVLATMCSLGGYVVISMRAPAATFYLIPTRAWELGIGSIATFLAYRDGAMRWARRLLPLALPVLLLVPFFPLVSTQVNYNPLFVCLATMVVILARSPQIENRRITHGLARIGNFSYSLYLIHWPLFSLVHILYLSETLPIGLSLVLVAIAIGVAWLMYRFIEEPARQSRLRGWRLVGTTLAGSMLVLALGFGGLAVKTMSQARRIDLAPATGLPVPGCFAQTATLQKNCVESDKPEIAIWGDSYGTQLISGLAAESPHPLAQLTKGSCGAMFNYAALAAANERKWTKGCIAFNEKVYTFLADHPSIRVVVISTRYSRYFNSSNAILKHDAQGRYHTTPASFDGLLKAQLAAARRLRKLGKRVIVVSPLPLAKFDVGQCWARRFEGLPTAGPYASCKLTPAGISAAYSETQRLMGAFETAGLPVIRLDRALCHGGVCETAIDGHPIYRDAGHMSDQGSKLVAHHVNLGARVWKEAK